MSHKPNRERKVNEDAHKDTFETLSTTNTRAAVRLLSKIFWTEEGGGHCCEWKWVVHLANL